MKKLAILVVVVATTIAAITSATASAVESGGVGGRPAYPKPNNPRTNSIFIYQLKPGQQATDGVKVLNNTNQEQQVTVDAVDSVLSSDGAFACRQAADPKKDVGAWVHLQETTISLAPQTNKIVPFTVTVPAKADVGEHDGCITIQAASQTATKSNKSGVLLSFRSAIRMVVTVPGKIVKKLNIAGIRVTQAKDGKSLVSSTLQNDGNVSLDVGQHIKLLTVFGSVAADVDEGSNPVLPHSQATTNYEVEAPFWGGLYRARVVASYDSNPNTELGVNKHALPVSKRLDSAMFFVVPSLVGGLIEAVVLLALAVAVYWLVRKRLHARHVKRHWKDFTLDEGDTLQSLAKDFHVSWKKIAQVNKLKAPYELKKGQKLKLPADKE